jgi:hypothetical protein
MDISTLTFDERDEFSRKPIAEKIITLLQSEIDISPMLIDGGWGTGKTEFCHKSINLLKEQDTHHLIYIDAFKADHADEPLMTVLAEVINVLPNDETKKSFTKKALPILRYTLKTAAKAGVSHFLRQDVADVVDEFDKEIQDVAGKVIDLSVMGLLKDHIESEKSLTTLKDALKEIVQEKPIAIFIDELDRCRPNFAVDMLEIIKHIFDTSAVSFVLITNTQQLRASINHCYGHSVDSQRYLDKFVKFSFVLPSECSSDGHRFKNVSVEHYEKLVRDSLVLKDTALEIESVSDFMADIIKVRDMSLREVETLIRHIEIYHTLASTPEQGGLDKQLLFGYTLLKLMGIVLFCFNTQLSSSISRKRADAKELANYFGENSLVPIIEGALQASHLQLIITILAKECFFNSNLFKPDDEDPEKIWLEGEWYNLVNSYFRGGAGIPSEGQITKAVIKTLRTLSLYTK